MPDQPQPGQQQPEQITGFSTSSFVRLIDIPAPPYVVVRVDKEKFKRLLDQIDRLKQVSENTSYDFHVCLAMCGIAVPSWPAWYTTHAEPEKTVWIVVASACTLSSLLFLIRWLIKRESLAKVIENKIKPIIREMMQDEAEQ